MKGPAGPMFLARQGYRRRRLGDAARILPMLGLVLFMAPLLGGQGHPTSGGGLWLFACWALLVAGAAGLSRALGRRLEETTEREAGGPGPGPAEPADPPATGPGPRPPGPG